MTVVLWVAATMLGVAALLALVRVVRGPSALDRAVAMDVLLSCLIGAIGIEAAYDRHGTTLPVLAVLALLGFVGSVAIARFGADVGDDDPDRREESRVRARLGARDDHGDRTARGDRVDRTTRDGGDDRTTRDGGDDRTALDGRGARSDHDAPDGSGARGDHGEREHRDVRDPGRAGEAR